MLTNYFIAEELAVMFYIQIVTHELFYELFYELSGWFSAGWWEILLQAMHIKYDA